MNLRQTIMIRSLLERRTSTIVWSLGLVALALLFSGIHQSFADDFNQLIDIYPENISAFVGDVALAAQPAGFLGLQLYNIFLPMIMGALGLAFGASAIGKEEDSGTLELLLASPVSRSRMLFQKAAAMETQLIIVGAALWLGLALGSAIFPFDIDLLNVLLATIMGVLLGIFYGTLALAIQAASGRRGLAISASIAVLVAGYFADALAQLLDWLEWLQYFSPFYYYDGPNVLLNGLGLGNAFVLAALSAVLYIIALISFNQRDTGI